MTFSRPLTVVGVAVSGQDCNCVGDLREVRGEHTVGTSYYWVLVRSRRYGNFDLRIRFGKFWEFMSQERPVQRLESWSAIKQTFNGWTDGKILLHSLRSPSPIAVVEIKAFALKYKSADTILCF